MPDGFGPLTYCRNCHVGQHVLCLAALVLPASVRERCECPSPRCVIDRIPHAWMRDRLTPTTQSSYFDLMRTLTDDPAVLAAVDKAQARKESSGGSA